MEGESAALTRGAAKLDFTTQKASQLTADGQAKPGSAVLAAGASVRLLEGFEDDALLIGSDSYAIVRHFKRHHGCGAAQNRMIFAPPLVSDGDREPDRTVLRKFECIGQQVLKHLL